MTTAKPHQAASQSDSADDLIAELAKLMAQDAQTDRPAPAPAAAPVNTAPEPAAPPAAPVASTPKPAATPSIRIPGVTPPPQPVAPQPVPRFDFAPTPAPEAKPSPAPQEPKVSEDAPEPFHFDFDLHAGPRKAGPASPVEPKVEPVAPQAAPVEPRVEEQAADEPFDAIADLISELHEEPAAPAPQSTSIAEAPQAWAPPKPAVSTPPEPSFEPAKPESDRFRIAPVFGLSPQAPKAQPAAPVEPVAKPVESRVAPSPFIAAEPEPVDERPADPDPIDEIESLIGRAVRVELGNADRGAAPRSLATPTLPQQPAPMMDHNAASGVDEAILAAAAASGVQVDWVNPEAAPSLDDEPAPRRKARREKAPRLRRPPISRAFVGPLVAVGLLLIAGVGLYWVLGLGRSDGPAPVLTADTTPVKEVPAAQPEAEDSPQSVVFNEMDGVVPGAEEQLVSRDQADINEVARAELPPAVSDEGVVNRKVRTVTVRPDGTIVSGDQTLAGSTILPVDRPNVPEVPGAQTASPELVANAEAGQPAPLSPQGVLTPVPTTTATPATTPVVPGSTVPVVDASGNPVAGRIAPVPFQRPASVGDAPPSTPTAALPTSPVNALVDPAQSSNTAAAPAPQAQAPAPALAPAASGGNAPAYVQLASQRSEEEARSTANAMASRFGSLFGGANLEIQRVDLGARGIYYRVRLPASSAQSASQICASVKANGGDCFTM